MPQSEVYVVRDGRIPSMRGVSETHPGDTAKVRDPVLVGDGVLRFTAKSAAPMRRWLDAWRRRTGGPGTPPS